MFSVTKLVVLLSVALSVAAMPSHMARKPHNHREIAARVALGEIEVVNDVAARDNTVPAKRVIRRKRDSGRCPHEDPNSTNTSTPKNDPKPTNTPHKDPTTTPKQDPPPTTTPKQDPLPVTTPTDEPTPTPTPTPVVDVKPTTTPPQEPPTTTTPTPTPTPTPTSGNNGGQTYTGQGTFYATGLGSCGITNNDSQDIAAVSHLFYDAYPGYAGGNPNLNPLCGKTATVTFGGKTITVSLTDRCEACAYGDLDFSPHAFDQLADPSVGRISGISWTINN